MPITVEFQDMFSYSVLLTAGTIVLVLIIGIVGLIVYMKTKNKKKVEVKPLPVKEKISEIKQLTPEQIKQKYCAMIDDLEKQCRAGKMSNRKAHQKLSEILRRFVYDLTGEKVHNFTLNEIERLNMPSVSSVIAECYAPEFSVDKDGSIYDTMNKTRMVIREWR